MVRAKMRCNTITKSGDPKKPTVQIQLGAVYSQDPESENKSFASYTPSASVQLSIDAGRPAATMFELGAEYYVDFVPCGVPERYFQNDMAPPQQGRVILETRDRSQKTEAQYDVNKGGFLLPGAEKHVHWGSLAPYEFWRHPKDGE